MSGGELAARLLGHARADEVTDAESDQRGGTAE
jgi:hypothetical protein